MNKTPILIDSALLARLGPLVGNALYAGPAGTENQLAELREGLPTVAYLAYSLEIAVPRPVPGLRLARVPPLVPRTRRGADDRRGRQ